MKKVSVILAFLLVIVLLTACSGQSQETTDMSLDSPAAVEEKEETAGDEPSSVDGELELTLEALSAFNGKDGQPAYVAYKGVVYDVSHIEKWSSGVHNGNMAGTDLTGKLEKAPHGVKNLDLAIRVGILID